MQYYREYLRKKKTKFAAFDTIFPFKYDLLNIGVVGRLGFILDCNTV